MGKCTEERFLEDVKNHQVNIIFNEGLHRHIRFSRPNSLTYYFDLITAPGILIFTGDMQTFVFSRIPDMFEFFRKNENDFNYARENKLSINPQYWAEKLLAAPVDGRTSGYKEYCPERLRQAVEERFNAYAAWQEISQEEKAEIWSELEDEVLGSENEFDAYQNALNFKHNGFDLSDFWEVDIKEYTYHYLWACYAIAWGIEQLS